jgi:hypothetical protein
VGCAVDLSGHRDETKFISARYQRSLVRLVSVNMPNAEPPIYPNGDRVAVIEQFVPNFSAPVFAPPVIAAALAELCKRWPRNEIDKFSAQGIALNKFQFAYVATTVDGQQAIKLAGFSRCICRARYEALSPDLGSDTRL